MFCGKINVQNREGGVHLAQVFKNKPTATATVTRYAQGSAGTTLKLAGINGEQTDAGNFSTAVTDFIAIGGILPATNGLERNISQYVGSDEAGVDPEFTLDPIEFEFVESFNYGSGSVTATISVGNYNIDVSGLTFSGKRPAGATCTVITDERELRIQGRSSKGYTEGTDSATMTVTLPAQTVDGTKYRSASVNITFTGGTAADFEDIS